MTNITVKEKESHTRDGSVAYAAVECNHCGYDTPADSCIHALFPRSAEKQELYSDTYIKVKFRSDTDQRVFCDDCATVLFGDVDRNNYLRELDAFLRRRELYLWSVATLHVVAGVLAVIGLIEVLLGVFG